MSTSRRTPWLEVLLAALPAALHAVVLLGRVHPDELFQSLEIANFRTWGYGIVPWEWHVPNNPATVQTPWGIRSWAVPLVLSGLFRVGDAVGITSVMGRRVLAELPLFVLHIAMLGAVWRLAARRVGDRLARACLWLVALYGPIVWFAGRTLSESFSAAFLVWGLERLDLEEPRRVDALLGGVLLGLAQVTRYGSAAVILPAMLWLLVQRRFVAFAFATLGGLVVGLLGLGLLDQLTWGEWFHSFIHYVRFNVTSGAAAQSFGTQPWWMYAPRLLLAPFAVVGLLAQGIRPGPGRRPGDQAALRPGQPLEPAHRPQPRIRHEQRRLHGDVRGQGAHGRGPHPVHPAGVRGVGVHPPARGAGERLLLPGGPGGPHGPGGEERGGPGPHPGQR
ncbi:MAG: glycosyltransferase 87 family protein, partial [Myxococcota bacterium]